MKKLASCSMWWEWGIDVYDSEGHRIQTRREKANQDNHFCFRNIALPIPAHTCGPLQDMGNVSVDLTKDYELNTGSYFITQKPLVLPLRGFSIKIADKRHTEGD